ncbi:MAG: histidine kinase [Clostridia bacterium]|nr:histidine kinase [Clostridia bacterium]
MSERKKNGGALHSLRIKMLLWAFIFVIPILIILCTSISAAIRSFDDLTRDNIDQILTPYTTEIDASLNIAKRYIANLNINLTDLNSGNELSRLRATQQLGQSVSESLTVYPEIDAVFFYYGDDLSFVQNYNRSYVVNSAAAAVLKEELNAYSGDSPLFQQGYMYFSANDSYFLYLALDVPGGAVGCWFSADYLVEPILQANPDGLVRVIFSDRQNRMLDSDFDTRSTRQLSERLAPYYVSSRELSSASFAINALWDREVVFAPISHMRRSVFTSISVSFLLFALYVAFLRTSLIRPLNRLVGAINGIRGGNLGQIPLRKDEDTEIANVYLALNAMTSQIETLRIQMYEEKLIKQRAQMQLFQLQLRPHFFLNALNTIISFARVKEYDMVQKMTMYLATHCRYILYSPWFVTVEEELIYTQNFVDMQSAQHDEVYRYVVRVEDELLDYEIPILGVQIFVENALKYCHSLDRPIRIQVTMREEARNNERCLYIEIEDTGDGFDAGILEALNGSGDIYSPEEDRGIGIANVRQRLLILYGGRATVRFCNRDEGGAHVEMYLPIDRNKGGSAQ